MSGRALVVLGALSGAVAVVAGALGAHALDGLEPPARSAFETGARYHLVHSVMICLVGVWQESARRSALAIAGWTMLAGVVGFSGSLYALALGAPSWLGPVTPIGGVALIGSWLCLAYAAWRR